MSVTIFGAIVAFVTIPLGAALWRDAPTKPQHTTDIRQVEVTTTTAEIATTTTRPGSVKPTVVRLSLPDTTPQGLPDYATTTTIAPVPAATDTTSTP